MDNGPRHLGGDEPARQAVGPGPQIGLGIVPGQIGEQVADDVTLALQPLEPGGQEPECVPCRGDLLARGQGLGLGHLGRRRPRIGGQQVGYGGQHLAHHALAHLGRTPVSPYLGGQSPPGRDRGRAGGRRLRVEPAHGLLEVPAMRSGRRQSGEGIEQLSLCRRDRIVGPRSARALCVVSLVVRHAAPPVRGMRQRP